MYLASWSLSDDPDFWHRDNPSISECKVTYSALYWPVTTSSTKLPPRGQLATMTNSTQLGLHVDEILDNNPRSQSQKTEILDKNPRSQSQKSVDSYAQGTWLTPILHVAPLTKNYSTHLLILQAMQATQLVENCLAVDQLFGGKLKDNLYHRQNLTLVNSICETATKSVFWIPTCVPGFKHAKWLVCWKCPGQFANRDERKFKTHFR